MSVGSDLKHFFAEEVRAAGAISEGVNAERVLKAFASVPREDHAGPGPWLLRSPLFGLATRRTPDANPVHLYHNVLIALDDSRGVNIGEPSLWARHLVRIEIAEGSSILQIGAGSGYYSAILAELVGDSGRVLAIECDRALAKMAAKALSKRANVRLCHGDATDEAVIDEGLFDLVVVFAGVTHPLPIWLRALKEQGRMLVPVTGSKGWGAMLLIDRDGSELTAVTLGRCGFFPCLGARDSETARRVDRLWAEPSRLKDKKLRLCGEGDKFSYEIDGQQY